jgi:hypothetical protein
MTEQDNNQAAYLQHIAMYLYAKYTQPVLGIVDCATKEQYKNLALQFGLPESESVRFSEAAVSNYFHIDEIERRRKNE